MTVSFPLQSLYPATFTAAEMFIDDIFIGVVQKTIEVVTTIFKCISSFFNKYSIESNDSNLKAFAFIGCLSLIALLILSVFRRHQGSIVEPPTPHHSQHSNHHNHHKHNLNN